jgi:hypothetical protein
MPDNNKDSKKWYQKKRYMIPGSAIVFLSILGGSGPTNEIPAQASPSSFVQKEAVVVPTITTPINVVTTPVPVAEAPTPAPVKTPIEYKSPVTSSNNLSNDNYYTNVSGNTVHAPAYSSSVPSGASAKCGDGTYSFSQHRQGTCSHHGGVSVWY